MSDSLKSAVQQASKRADVLAAVQAVYEDIRSAIEARQPVCQMSGRCCKFEEYGHRLYVSTLELAAFVAGNRSKEDGGRLKDDKNGESTSGSSSLRLQLLSVASDSAGTCPFQVGKLCGVHTIRPFGCRMFFCDTSATEWQQETYERFHARMKALHDELQVPYFYVEWRAALQDVLAIQTA